MKQGSYKIKKQNSKEKFERMVTINGKDVNFYVEITKNHNNGTFKIKPVISFHHCSMKAAENNAFKKLVGDLAGEAMVYGLEWKKNWEADNPKNPNQMSIEDD